MRPRVGVSLRRRPDRLLGRILLGLLAVAVFWYALMAVLLSVKVSPHSVNSLSGYHSAYNFLATLRPRDVDGWRWLVALVAALLCAILATIAVRQVPTPARGRRERTIDSDRRGVVTVAPLVLERLAEIAAGRQPAIERARAISGPDGLNLSVTIHDPHEPQESLRGVQRSVAEALQGHGLDAEPVNVVLTGYQPRKGRQLQ